MTRPAEKFRSSPLRLAAMREEARASLRLRSFPAKELNATERQFRDLHFDLAAVRYEVRLIRERSEGIFDRVIATLLLAACGLIGVGTVCILVALK